VTALCDIIIQGYPSYGFNDARAYSRKPEGSMNHLDSSPEATAFMVHVSEPLPQRDEDNTRGDHPSSHRYDSSHHSYNHYLGEQTFRNGNGEISLAEWPNLSECGGGTEDMSPYSCSSLHVSSRVVTTDVSSKSDMHEAAADDCLCYSIGMRWDNLPNNREAYARRVWCRG